MMLSLRSSMTGIKMDTENIAPQIIRQRLLIEANYSIIVDEKVINDYLTKVAETLNLRIYGEPIIHSPSGDGKEVNQGYASCR